MQQERGRLHEQERRELILSVGGLALRVRPQRGLRLRLDAASTRFSAPGAKPSLYMSVRRRSLPPAGGARFETHVWELHADGAISAAYSGRARRVLRVDPGWRRGVLGWSGRSPRRDAWPFKQPLLELIYLHLAAAREAVPLHAAAVVHEGRALAFAGRSGSGKTTLARLWRRAFPGDLLLTDDRAMLRPGRGKWTAWGTPWGGRGRIASPSGAPLAAILVLKNARATRLRRLPPSEAAARLLPCHLLPYWDRALARRALGHLDRLVRAVPVWELSFPRTVAAARYVAGRLAIQPASAATGSAKPARPSSRATSPGPKTWQKTHGPAIPGPVT